MTDSPPVYMPLKRFATNDNGLFLQKEYEYFKDIFKSPEKFEQVMADVIDRCDKCNVIHWRGCEKRCDCEYLSTIEQ